MLCGTLRLGWHPSLYPNNLLAYKGHSWPEDHILISGDADGAGGIVQRLRTLAAFAEALGSIPSSNISRSKTPVTLASVGHLCACDAHKLTQAHMHSYQSFKILKKVLFLSEAIRELLKLGPPCPSLLPCVPTKPHTLKTNRAQGFVFLFF